MVHHSNHHWRIHSEVVGSHDPLETMKTTLKLPYATSWSWGRRGWTRTPPPVQFLFSPASASNQTPKTPSASNSFQSQYFRFSPTE
ncbi:hypothetical protein ACFX12_021670 [Malus domestica]